MEMTEHASLLSGDELQTYTDDTVEHIRDGKVIATTRWVSDSSDSFIDGPNKETI